MRPLGETYGIDLRALDGKPFAEPTPCCPGARIRVTRNDVKVMAEGGERFVTDKAAIPIPKDGYGDARVYCTNLVDVGPRGCSGEPVVYGLCSSCQGLEDDNRAMLLERQNAREKERVPRP